MSYISISIDTLIQVSSEEQCMGERLKALAMKNTLSAAMKDLTAEPLSKSRGDEAAKVGKVRSDVAELELAVLARIARLDEAEKHLERARQKLSTLEDNRRQLDADRRALTDRVTDPDTMQMTADLLTVSTE